MRSKIKSLLPKLDANKYSRGKLTIFAGSSRFEGAALLCAMAGLRSGCGYVELFTEDTYIAPIQIAYPSLVVNGYRVWEGKRAFLSSESRPQAVCIGPGMPAGDEFYASLVKRVTNQSHCPLVMDAGALSYVDKLLVEKFLIERHAKGYLTIITPHYGEACSMATKLEINEDDPSCLAVQLSQCLHSTVVLKGPVTFVAHYDDLDESSSFDKGTPALAKAGTGDILAGILSSILAQNTDYKDAVQMALELHACAAHRAEQKLTQISVNPEDIIEFIPDAFSAFLNEPSKGE